MKLYCIADMNPKWWTHWKCLTHFFPLNNRVILVRVMMQNTGFEAWIHPGWDWKWITDVKYHTHIILTIKNDVFDFGQHWLSCQSLCWCCCVHQYSIRRGWLNNTVSWCFCIVSLYIWKKNLWNFKNEWMQVR